MSGTERHPIRQGAAADAPAIGRLLDDFNREFGEPTPGANALAARVGELIRQGETVVLLTGEGPDGLAVLRFRPAIWSAGLECYLAELYVAPPLRGRGIGRALMDAALCTARERGADTMEMGVDASDTVARHLYERLGFRNHVHGEGGPVMYVYERDL